MRLLIDAYWWVDGPYSNRLVLREIVSQWRRSFPQDHLVLAVPSKWSDAEADLPLGTERVSTKLRRHPVINAFELPRYAKSGNDIDAMLLQNFGAPSTRAAVLVHDMLFQSNPEWFTRVERLYLSLIPALAKRTGRVLATTRTEATRIAEYTRVSSPVAVTGLGLSSTLLGATSRKPNVDLRSGAFVLTVGRLNIRKNLVRTIEAAVRSGAISRDQPLVVVGQPSGRSAAINETVEAAVESGSVLFVDFAEDAELRWLYENCSVFCFLSLGEGYGLPPVEAAYFGARVLASDIPVLRENLGPHAEYVDPLDVPAISESLDKLVHTEVTRGAHGVEDRLAGNGLSGSWDATVEAIRNTLLGTTTAT